MRVDGAYSPSSGCKACSEHHGLGAAMYSEALTGIVQGREPRVSVLPDGCPAAGLLGSCKFSLGPAWSSCQQETWDQ